MQEQRDNIGDSFPSGPCAPSGSGRVGSFRAQVDDLAAQAREDTARLASDAREQLRGLVFRRQIGLAERLGGVAAALHDAGRRLDDEVAEGLGELVDRAAHGVDRASRYVLQSELQDMVRDVANLARRRPGAFLGGAFVAGLLLARFLKSSGERAAWAPGGAR